jgi:hypothetical protein
VTLAVRGTIAAVVAFACGVSSAAAQSRPGYPAVFGGAADSNADAPEALNVLLNVTEAFDQDLLADAGATPQPGPQSGGVYSTMTPQISWQKHGRRVQFSANESSTFQYYPEFDQAVATNHNFGAGVSAKLGQETTLTVNEAFSYAPTYLYALFASPSTPILGAPIVGAPDYQTNDLRSYTSATNANVTHALSSRASLSLYGDFRFTDSVGSAPGLANTRWSDAGGRLLYSMNRSVGLRFGYTYRQSSYSPLLQTDEQSLEIGFDLSRPLSATRRWTMGFSLGPTLITQPATAGGPPQDHYRVLADVSFDHQIGRTWSARAGYHRGLSYIETLSGPVYTQSTSVETSGFVNRRVDLSFLAAYATGELASPIGPAAPFTTYTATSRMRVAVSRELAVYIAGLFYDYAFDPRLIIVPGMPSQLTRSGVRAGVTLWLPVKADHRAAR